MESPGHLPPPITARYTLRAEAWTEQAGYRDIQLPLPDHLAQLLRHLTPAQIRRNPVVHQLLAAAVGNDVMTFRNAELVKVPTVVPRAG